jgi:hypothetical protein
MADGPPPMSLLRMLAKAHSVLQFADSYGKFTEINMHSKTKTVTNSEMGLPGKFIPLSQLKSMFCSFASHVTEMQ